MAGRDWTRLWHFPLTAEAAQVVLDNASPQVPILLTTSVRSASSHCHYTKEKTCFCLREETDTVL